MIPGRRWCRPRPSRLTAADGEGGNAFGAAVALTDDAALIGSPFDSPVGAASGSTYVFARSGANWTQQTKLATTDGSAVDFFGASVALSGSSAAVGAPGRDDLGSSSGATYVFVPAATRNGDACAIAAYSSQLTADEPWLLGALGPTDIWQAMMDLSRLRGDRPVSGSPGSASRASRGPRHRSDSRTPRDPRGPGWCCRCRPLARSPPRDRGRPLR